MNDSGADDLAKYFEKVENDGGNVQNDGNPPRWPGVRWIRLIVVVVMGEFMRENETGGKKKKKLRRALEILRGAHRRGA